MGYSGQKWVKHNHYLWLYDESLNMHQVASKSHLSKVKMCGSSHLYNGDPFHLHCILLLTESFSMFAGSFFSLFSCTQHNTTTPCKFEIRLSSNC
jgi:hypothetical protein